MKLDQKTTITLDYINKLNINLQIAGRMSNQFGLINLILSVFLVAFSYRFFQIKNEILFNGLSFEMNLTNQIMLLALSALVTITYLFESVMGSHSRLLREHVRRLYIQLEFSDLSMDASPSPLEHPHFIGNIFDLQRIPDKKTGRPHKLYVLYRGFIWLVSVAFPLIAQIWATNNQFLLANKNANIVYMNLPIMAITLIEIIIHCNTPFRIESKQDTH